MVQPGFGVEKDAVEVYKFIGAIYINLQLFVENIDIINLFLDDLVQFFLIGLKANACCRHCTLEEHYMIQSQIKGRRQFL